MAGVRLKLGQLVLIQERLDQVDLLQNLFKQRSLSPITGSILMVKVGWRACLSRSFASWFRPIDGVSVTLMVKEGSFLWLEHELMSWFFGCVSGRLHPALLHGMVYGYGIFRDGL